MKKCPLALASQWSGQLGEGNFNRAWKSDYILGWQTSSIDHSFKMIWLWSGEERHSPKNKQTNKQSQRRKAIEYIRDKRQLNPMSSNSCLPKNLSQMSAA